MVLKGERMQQGDTKTHHVYSLNYKPQSVFWQTLQMKILSRKYLKFSLCDK